MISVENLRRIRKENGMTQAELALQFVELLWEMDEAGRDKVRRFIMDWGN
ncbi:MAG: hypothetical protein LUE14_09205 [Clostridiales bacterium]|nr:hypothetical protein [Clostridiales bacterium]